MSINTNGPNRPLLRLGSLRYSFTDPAIRCVHRFSALSDVAEQVILGLRCNCEAIKSRIEALFAPLLSGLVACKQLDPAILADQEQLIGFAEGEAAGISAPIAITGN